MERVLKQTLIKSIIVFLLFFLCSAQSSFATTVIIPSDDDMVIGARAIVRGKVVAIESSFDEQNSRIYTYITVKVREVLKGQIAERKIVLKELGGQVGDKISVIYGNPRFKKGEQVLLYLDTWADGSLRTYQMFLGKFNVVKDPITGKEMAVRSSPDENTTVLQHQLHGHGTPGHSTERQKLSAYTRMVRDRLAANWERSVRFEAEAHGSIPVLAEPPEYRSIAEDLNPQFTFLGPFRFFEPDSGQPVSFSLNPNPSSQQGVPQVTLNSADVAAAGNAWSNVTGSALTMSYSGAMNECYAGTGIPGVHVVSNNCDGRNGATSGCAGILAWGGVSQTGQQTRTINGTTFRQTIQGFVSMNPWASCHFTVNCNVQEVLTHEIGHAIGLGHSQFSDATMAAFAHFDGRCASIRTDDVDGLRAIYPGTGGPGPLTVTTSTLANGTIGSTYSQTLQASGGTLPYSWSIVSGLGNLPPGLGLNPSSGGISGAPTTTGTYNFTVRVTDSVPATAQKALSIVVTQPGIAYNSQFVSQTTPTSVTPGQTLNVNMKWLNTGTQTWSGSLFYLASQNPALNETWGGNAVSLSSFVVSPGQQLDVTFQASAPVTPGTYNFQWQLFKNDGTGFFGQVSPNVAVQVGSPPPPAPVDNASFVSQSIPSSMIAGQTAGISVTMSNTGNTTWAAGTYFLGSQNPQANSTWGLNRVNVASPVAPGGQATFTFNVTAPIVPGTYNFQWQMAKDGGGSFGSMSTNLGIAVSAPVRKTPFEFDGDGKADIAVYRPSNGYWFTIKSSNSQVGVTPWGLPGDIPVPADYDGDGKTDIAVFRPSDGNWFIIYNSTGQVKIQQWALSGDVPVPADYDGDGKADIAVFRPSDGNWFIINSSTGQVRIRQWALSGDLPVPVDYDGDGKADIAVYRPSNGYWFVINSSNAQVRIVPWGLPGDMAVPADYDGDGKTDIAVFRPAGGNWYIINSSTGQVKIQQWALSGDKPVPADYDGDGKADMTVYRPSDGNWFIINSSTGQVRIQQWALNGDMPVPFSFVK